MNFHGERRSNDTHQSTTDPDSRLAKKTRGSEAKLAYLGEVLMDNRHGLVVDACVVHATGTGECAAALGLLAALPPREATVGADKAYDTRGWVAEARQLGVTPHVAQKQRSAIDGRTTRHPGYAVSQRVRKRVEEIFGWMKTVGGLRKLRHRGGDRVEWHFLFVAAAYNLVRLRNLPTETAGSAPLCCAAARNITSHSYDKRKAERIVAQLPQFARDVHSLLALEFGY